MTPTSSARLRAAHPLHLVCCTICRREGMIRGRYCLHCAAIVAQKLKKARRDSTQP